MVYLLSVRLMVLVKAHSLPQEVAPVTIGDRLAFSEPVLSMLPFDFGGFAAKAYQL